MKRLLLFAGLAAFAHLAFAQAVPGQGPVQTPRPGQPRRSGGAGGVGVSVDLGTLFGKRKPASPPLQPLLEMRDADIPDSLPDQIIFITSGPPTPQIATAAKIVILETSALDEAGIVMTVAQLAVGDSVPAAQARLHK
jgi:hypothetical protein